MKTSLLSLLFFLMTWSFIEATPDHLRNAPKTLNQDTVVLAIDSIVAEKGELVCLQLSVDNFKDVILMEMSILIDSEVLRFVNAGVITNLLPGFTRSSFSTPENNSSSDKIIISWIDSDLNGEQLPAFTEIFEMCFEVIGEQEDKSSISINNIEMANSSNELIDVEVRNGLVCVDNNVSAEEEMLVRPLQFYPNPSRDAIQFNRPVQELSIFDTQGRKVLEFEVAPRTKFDLGSLSRGNYWMQTADKTFPLRIN